MEGTEIIDPNEEGIAIPEEYLEGIETEETTTEDEVVDQEATEEEVVEEGTEEVSEETEEVKDNTEEEDFKDKESLLKALNNERKQRKELQKQLKTSVKEESKKSTYDSLVESGIDTEIAKTIAKAIEEPMQEVAGLKYENNILQMSKKPGFEDVQEYADDMKPLIDKGLTYEQAYYAISGSQKTVNTKREIERELEAKLKNNKAKQKVIEVDSQATSPEVKEKKARYTQEQIAVASAAGMSIEDYIEFSKMRNTKDYDKYKNK